MPGYGVRVESFEVDSAGQGELLDELLRLQAAMETIVVPELVEPLLSIRLTMQQLKVLGIILTDADGSTVQGLSKTLGVSLATMSGIVDRLTGQGMATRVEDLNDHRVRRVVATDRGREVMQELLAARPQLSRPPLERLDIEDLRALTRGVGALLRALEAEAAAATDADASADADEQRPER
jgi:DNA-binding MarR family transcriptional regulator